MEIKDIHTHRADKEAIQNVSFRTFAPQAGQYYSVGIHPWDISSGKFLTPVEQEILIEEQKKMAKHPQVIAIGEAGLDKLISTNMEVQMKVFEQQIQLAEQVEKPLIIHAVRTFNELIGLKQQYKPSVAWIIHGFRGNKQIAEQLVRHGFYLSFGEKYQEEALRQTPLNRIFMETDESTQPICSFYRKAAETLWVPFPDFSENIRQNIRQVFFNR